MGQPSFSSASAVAVLRDNLDENAGGDRNGKRRAISPPSLQIEHHCGVQKLGVTPRMSELKSTWLKLRMASFWNKHSLAPRGIGEGIESRADGCCSAYVESN
jgi:hypothetical protein